MKPVATIKRCWSAIQDSFRVLFRALGLNLIVAGVKALRHASVGKGYDEPIKKAIRRSRKTALLRALIHVAPAGVALWEIILNWNTYYVGATIRNLAYYQFGAKIHEIAAQASLAAVVFTYIRYELALGQGLPFGALFSGLQISQASYLWSMEFWGTACSKHLPVRRRIGIILVISIAISLASVIGPSSAILLIPRLAYWPAGSTDIWLNATFQDIWPDRTNGSLVPTSCHTWNPVTYDAICPSSDWQAIQKALELQANSIPPSEQCYTGSSTPGNLQVTGRSSLRTLSLLGAFIWDIVDGKQKIVFNSEISTSQHSAVADALTTTGILWSIAMTNASTKGHGSVLSQLDSVHTITNGYYQPYTSVACNPEVINGLSDIEPLGFPSSPGLDFQITTPDRNSSGPQDNLVFPNITRAYLLNTPGPLAEYRLRWIDLPFNGIAIGAVILLPRSAKNATQEVYLCSIGAGWGLSKMNYTDAIDGDATPIVSQINFKSATSASRPGPQIPDSYFRGSTSAEELSLAQKLFYYYPVFPQRPVVVTEDWARYLNPSIEHLNTTIINVLMGLNWTPDGNVKAQTILAGMVANGLARIGSASQLQGTVKQSIKHNQSIGFDGDYWFAGKGNNVFQVNPQESKDWVKLRVSSTIKGYAYNTQGTTTKLAIGLLLAYSIIAIAHIIYAGISGISSTCWDSISEVTALAMNSTPTAALRNTCAGITELNIFKLPVRVLAFRDAEGDGEHLELVFEKLDEKTLKSRTIKANRAYGTMPNMKAHDKVA